MSEHEVIKDMYAEIDEVNRKVKMLELMLYRESGGSGYDLAIRKLAKDSPKYFKNISENVKGIKSDSTGRGPGWS